MRESGRTALHNMLHTCPDRVKYNTTQRHAKLGSLEVLAALLRSSGLAGCFSKFFQGSSSEFPKAILSSLGVFCVLLGTWEGHSECSGLLRKLRIGLWGALFGVPLSSSRVFLAFLGSFGLSGCFSEFFRGPSEVFGAVLSSSGLF